MCQTEPTCKTHMNACGQHTDYVTLVTMYQKLCTHGKSGTYSDQLCNVRIVLSWESCYKRVAHPFEYHSTTQGNSMLPSHILRISCVISIFLHTNCTCYQTCA